MKKGRESKPHIGIFGRRNVGKSSIINVLAGQEVAIVSDVAGTTTDPVKKSMEVDELGAVVIIDTAGIDDEGELGQKRIKRSLKAIELIDSAILVISENQFGKYEKELVEQFRFFEIPFFIIQNKTDVYPADDKLMDSLRQAFDVEVLPFSAVQEDSPNAICKLIKKVTPNSAFETPTIIGDLVNYGDIVVLVTPIDIEAPAGRIILPQVQTIRDILDNDCVAVVLKERELDAFLKKTKIKPALVVTDSQVFPKVDGSVPQDIPMTSFSILLARLKGEFDAYLKGTPHISKLNDGDKVLMLESCTHQVSCDDIGRVKIPRWIAQFTGKKIEFEVIAGLDEIPHDVEQYAMVIQCGGCVATRQQIRNRLMLFIKRGVPVSNYGMTISYLHGIFNRAVKPFFENSSANETLYL